MPAGRSRRARRRPPHGWSDRAPSQLTPPPSAGPSSSPCRRRAGLAVVVQFDDLGRLEEGGGQLGEAHHEDGADRGWALIVAAGEGRVAAWSSSVKPVVPTTAWTPCSAHQGQVGWRSMRVNHTSPGLGQQLMSSAMVTPAAVRPTPFGSTAATSSRSGSPSMARHAVPPPDRSAPRTRMRIGRHGSRAGTVPAAGDPAGRAVGRDRPAGSGPRRPDAPAHAPTSLSSTTAITGVRRWSGDQRGRRAVDRPPAPGPPRAPGPRSAARS